MCFHGGRRQSCKLAPSTALLLHERAQYRAHKAPAWNDKSADAVKAKRAAHAPREQRLLEDYACHNGTACLRAAQLLRDVAALSAAHDACGLLQLPPQGVPGFADVAHVLLHTYALLDHFLLVRAALRCWVQRTASAAR